ncbi:MAG: hypothetical protein ACR2FS_18085, partial [Phormidesmis sp.]
MTSTSTVTIFFNDRVKGQLFRYHSPFLLPMSIPLAMVATQLLDRPGLAKKTVKSYEQTLMPLLSEYGSWPIEICDRQIL